MAITLDSFQRAAATGGLLKLDTDKSGSPEVKSFGTGVFGKITSLIRDPGPEANRSLKNSFMSVLTQRYGAEFSKSIADRLELNDRAPLSAKVVRDILKEAQVKNPDVPVQRRDIEITQGVVLKASPFVSPQEMKDAARTFISNAKFSSGGNFQILQQVASNVNKPDGRIDILLGAQKDFGAMDYAVAMGGDHGKRKLMEVAANNPTIMENFSKLNVSKESNAMSLVALIAQIPTRHEMTSRELVKNIMDGNDVKTRHTAMEFIAKFGSQVNQVENGIALLSKPEVLKNLPSEVKQGISDLRNQLIDMRNAMMRPDSPIQKMLAFAAMIIMEPNETISHYKEAVGPLKDVRPPKVDVPEIDIESTQPKKFTPPPSLQTPTEFLNRNVGVATEQPLPTLQPKTTLPPPPPLETPPKVQVQPVKVETEQPLPDTQPKPKLTPPPSLQTPTDFLKRN